MGFKTQFHNKSAIVTGAASGLGRELTIQLIQAGAHVMALDINSEGLKSLQKDLSASQSQLDIAILDVSNCPAFSEAIRSVKKKHGQLDFIFNNAGFAIFDEAKAMTDEQWERIIDVNIRGVVNGTQLAYKVMCEQKQGHIVNTASGAGLIPIPLMTAYCMTKHAVVGLSTSLRNEAKSHNVNVSVICPGVISTNIFHSADSHSFDISSLRSKAKISEVPVEKAVSKILTQVTQNKAKIVFPFSIKATEKFYAFAPGLYSKLSQLGIRTFLQKMQ